MILGSLCVPASNVSRSGDQATQLRPCSSYRAKAGAHALETMLDLSTIEAACMPCRPCAPAVAGKVLSGQSTQG